MIYPVPYQRDPLSQVFDPVTRRALARCYAAPGRWVPARLPRAGARLFVAWYARGVDLHAADPWDDGLDRYVRGFIRSAYWQHRWHGGYEGLQPERRPVPWDGLVLVYDADKQAGQWRVRLMAAPKGDKRLPRRKRKFTRPDRAGVGGY
jgi:hypothetical protein